jgi:hypothetical protein
MQNNNILSPEKQNFSAFEPSSMTVPNEQDQLKRKRKEALAKLDNAKFGWFHVKACIVSGIVLFYMYLAQVIFVLIAFFWRFFFNYKRHWLFYGTVNFPKDLLYLIQLFCSL